MLDGEQVRLLGRRPPGLPRCVQCRGWRARILVLGKVLKAFDLAQRGHDLGYGCRMRRGGSTNFTATLGRRYRASFVGLIRKGCSHVPLLSVRESPLVAPPLFRGVLRPSQFSAPTTGQLERYSRLPNIKLLRMKDRHDWLGQHPHPQASTAFSIPPLGVKSLGTMGETISRPEHQRGTRGQVRINFSPQKICAPGFLEDASKAVHLYTPEVKILPC